MIHKMLRYLIACPFVQFKRYKHELLSFPTTHHLMSHRCRK